MREFVRDKASNRRVRLFACACCRTVWESIPEVFQAAIRIAEDHVDGRATKAELGAAVGAAHRALRKRQYLEKAAYDAARSSSDGVGAARDIARVVASVAAPDPSPTLISSWGPDGHTEVRPPPNPDRILWEATYAAHLSLESSLLRDITGNPFRTVTITPSLLTETVAILARTIYEERAFDRMPILADALEECGVSDSELLAHCRGPGPHVRGCWVVDLVLGKS